MAVVNEAAGRPDDVARLIETVRSHDPKADTDLIARAYDLADEAHSGQTRRSGEPYIGHPVAVAEIVAGLGMDAATVAAALLHDVVEDTGVSLETVASKFGADVAHLVDGVTKLRLQVVPDATAREKKVAETTRAAESLRRLLLAQDVRVMVIKLADRLHNMRTLDALPPEKQTRIANETLDVYAPLAARLGIWQVKWQLEDLAFKTLHPREFHEISERVAKSRTQREDELRQATDLLKARMVERGLGHCEIRSRPKHLFSIYNKIVQQGIDFEEIYDLQAMRVICAEQHECYLVLGLVHELWQPIPGLFFDYIALPKPNGYQSIHTKVMGPAGTPLELQIRTQAMHEVAEFGVAAHFSYKEGDDKNDAAEKLTDLRRQLFDWSSDSRTSSDFLRAVSTDLFSEQVFVFTPKGDVLDLPKDSTPIDFAFRVHSDIGLRTVGAKVNGAIVPLNQKLQNGDVVELITRSNAQPSLDWLEFIKSQHTKSKLRAYFRKRNRSESVQRGKEALDRGLKQAGFDSRHFLGEDRLNGLAKEFRHCETGEDVLARIGEGLLSVQTFVDKVRGLVKEQQPELLSKVRSTGREVTTIAGGVDNVMFRRAKCCLAVPGEDVVGFVTRGRGIIIHRRVCPNAIKLMETEGERIIPLEWPGDGKSYSVDLKLVCVNRQGLLMDISTIFGESKTNVSGANIKSLPNHTAEIEVTIDVADVQHLQAVMAKIGNLSDILSILRVFGRSARA
jgi:GTP diphosphokinase / guanosine-3',5'-bis(diphosphate) 3'-diphosphatase